MNKSRQSECGAVAMQDIGGVSPLNFLTTNTERCTGSITLSKPIAVYSSNAGAFKLRGWISTVITGDTYISNYTITYQGSAEVHLNGLMMTKIYQSTSGGSHGTDAWLAISGVTTCGFSEFSTLSLVN